ncbi:MAG: hypothetical protein NC350_06320 [Corallococcus sp.]|nr:hypothetical protein [Corallococcus sp.]
MANGKIKLENERCEHLTKRLNRLSTWGFFKVLYRNSFLKMFLTNILMLVFCAPMVATMYYGQTRAANLLGTLPYYGTFGQGGGVWFGVADYFTARVAELNHTIAWITALTGILLCFMLSGGFAIIRDAFWTGNIKVFPCFWRGIKSNLGYAAVSSVIISAMVYGCVEFYWWASAALPLWATIILMILFAVIAFLVTMYLFVLCSITVTYKQSVKQSLADSWHMLWLNILPHIVRMIVFLLPVGIALLASSMLQMLVLMFMMLVGFFYFPFVWQTHMMKIFALFHPVPVNKKGETKQTLPTPQAPQSQQ